MLLKSISKKNEHNEIPKSIQKLVKQNMILARLLSFLSSRIDLFNPPILESLPSFDETKLTFTKETETNLIKTLKPVNLLEEQAFILWLARQNVKKRSNQFNQKLLNGTQYFLKLIDLETDLRFEAANACIVNDDFYDDDHFKGLEVDWLQTNEQTLTYKKPDKLKPFEITNELIKKIYELFYQMVFEIGYFGFDFTKENLALTDDHKIVLLDYSSIIKIKPEKQSLLTDLLITLLNNDYQKTILAVSSNFKINHADHLLNRLASKTYILEKFEVLLQETTIDFPEYFLFWRGLQSIKKLAASLELNEAVLDNELKAFLLNQNQASLFTRKKLTKLPDFVPELTADLITRASKKPKYFFQTDSKCSSSKKESALFFVFLWLLLLMIIVWFLII